MTIHALRTSIKSILNGRTTFFVAAIVGALFLHRLARGVEHPTLERPTRGPNIIGSEVIAIYAPARLIEFAESHGPIRTHEDLARAIHAAGLKGFWYSINVGDITDDGGLQPLTRIIHPGKERLQFASTLAALETLAGRPPIFDTVDYRPAEIFVIDESYMGEKNPIETMKDIEEVHLAHAPRPYHAARRVGFRAERLGRRD